MGAIAGLRGTGDWATDERPKNFREYILFRNPNGTAPMFAMMGKLKKEPVDDSEFSWWDEPNDLVQLQVNGAISDTAATTIVVDSSDPDSSSPYKVYGATANLKAGDMLLVQPATDTALLTQEVIEVVSVLSTTAISVKRGAQGTTAATIADDAFLLKIGSAYAEGTAAPSANSRNPIKYKNYTQIFKDTYELTGSADATKTRTGNTRENDKKRKAFDHSRDIEHAMLFGRASETTGDNGKPKRTMGGLRSFLGSTTSKLLGSSWTLNDLLDNIQPVFDFDTEAGDQRVAFCGNNALTALNKKIAAQTGTAQITFAGKTKFFGMQFNEYAIPQGTILLKTHPLMNRNVLYRNSMFLVDFTALRYRPLKGRDTKFMDDVQAKDEDVRRGYWMTDAGLEVRYGGLTCGYIGGFNL